MGRQKHDRRQIKRTSANTHQQAAKDRGPTHDGEALARRLVSAGLASPAILERTLGPAPHGGRRR